MVGVDIVGAFAPIPEGLRVEFHVGDLNNLREAVGHEQFDLLAVLQSIGYANDEYALLRDLWEPLVPGGALVIARSHPIRFAVERSAAEHVPLGAAYRAEAPFTYPSTWGSGTVTHRTSTFAQTLQPALDAGFILERVDEPAPTRQLRKVSPERAEWRSRSRRTTTRSTRSASRATRLSSIGHHRARLDAPRRPERIPPQQGNARLRTP